jgi:predicted PurR-regulated permease PerM
MLAVVLVFGVMYLAGEFLIPLIFSVLIATLLVPFCRWMEHRGMARGLAATISATMVLLLLLVIVAFIAWQVRSFANDAPRLKEQLLEHVQTGHAYVEENFGVTVEDVPEQPEVVPDDEAEEQEGTAATPVRKPAQKPTQKPGAEEAAAAGEEEKGNRTIPMSEALQYLFELMKIGFGTLFTLIIIYAYIVLFLYYRHRLRDAIVMMFPPQRKERTKHALREAGAVGQSYLGGMFIVTTILGFLNSFWLYLIGIEHPLLFGFLAGYLNFIPFIGTLVGSILPIGMALLTESTIVPALLVAVSFTFNQILEETVLTPKIVGSKVNVNPLFIIFAIVLGNMVWGIPGIVLFIPLTAIVKIIFDHVDELKPLAHFLGQKEDEKPTLFRRIRNKITGERGTVM